MPVTLHFTQSTYRCSLLLFSRCCQPAGQLRLGALAGSALLLLILHSVALGLGGTLKVSQQLLGSLDLASQALNTCLGSLPRETEWRSNMP